MDGSMARANTLTLTIVGQGLDPTLDNHIMIVTPQPPAVLLVHTHVPAAPTVTAE